LLAMINDILDLSKIEAGRMDLQKSDFDLGSLIQGLAAMFKVRCEEKDLELRVEWNAGQTATPALPVRGDEGKLRQVLINLLGNAVKFTDRGTITLRTRKADGQTLKYKTTPGADEESALQHPAVSLWHFEILDTGKGISAENLRDLFQPFQQGTEGMKKGGTGLGLAITKRQVELMGGQIGVESTVGQGSRFYFEIPLAPAQGEIAVQSEKDIREVIGLAAGCVVRTLVVDDVRQNREVLSQLLTGIGCEVTLADGGSAALEQL